MQFDQFLEKINVVVSQPLFALDAHLKMAPLERIQYLQNYDYSAQNPKASAVLSLFYPKNNAAHLLLIVRSSYPGVHSSQIAFPGGKRELTDKDLQETALRETTEEVGVAASEIEIVKQWSDIYIPPSNFMVSSFMGISKNTPQFILQPDEVSAVIELPVSELLSDALVQNVEMTTSYATNISVPAFVIEEHIVWGATAMILSEIKETLKVVF
ncbi:CoA pyrophosphatase [Flavobacterium sp. CBA20B-1]|uniref:NUDIX hydrolase n=1 Tax=unclassified Flavobacterium TaxID=196869 RepID=UPI002224A8C3|nr:MULTISPECIES: CoA pyrophosphatase [unclassified Flavobacterium]WCM42576.1 CoA pyrophosphatase [Flavobacterium sp. CBA20B-1]